VFLNILYELNASNGLTCGHAAIMRVTRILEALASNPDMLPDYYDRFSQLYLIKSEEFEALNLKQAIMFLFSIKIILSY
jgi:hypothetical protein